MNEKPPAIMFYGGDWLRDADLARCSKSAAGVWMYMIALSLQCEEPGIFRTKGKPWTEIELARSICGSVRVNLRAIRELILNHVAKVSDDGSIYCKRVVEDCKKRKIAKENGSKGGNPALSGLTQPLTLACARSAADAFALAISNKTAADSQEQNSPAAAAPLGFEAKDALARKLILNAECESLTAPDRKIFHEVAQAVLDGKLPESTAVALAVKAAKGTRNKAGLFRRLVSEHQE